LRSLVYALILANLGFWAWTAWFAPQPPEPSRFDGPGLTLLSEFTPAEVPVEPETPPPAETSVLDPLAGAAADAADEAEVARCINVGPFIEPEAAESAQAALAATGVEVRTVIGEQEVGDGFWVYIGELADMDEARAVLGRIEEQGLDDAYIIQNSDSGILVSLGIYSDLARAGSLADRVSDVGFVPTVAERTRTDEVVWLEFEQAGDGTGTLDLLQQFAGEVLEQRDCPAEL
jgi:hypothetical protein